MADPENKLHDYSAKPNADGLLQISVPIDCAGLRLDQALAKLFPEYSRSRMQEWIVSQQVTVDGRFASTREKLWGGEQLAVSPQSHPAEQPHLAEDISLDICYEDETLLVINKPVGLVVHPGSGNWEGTLLNALLHHDAQLESVPRAGIVHRLDKDTSGLLVVAKTLTAQTNLVRQLQARSVRREYLALVYGELRYSCRVDEPVGRHPVNRVKMAVTRSGKPAVTHFEVEENFLEDSSGSGRGCTLLRCRLETGRTHQIRVHLAHLKHPLVGDSVYLNGPQKCMAELRELLASFPRQSLHAERLALQHPVSDELMEWQAPLPEDMTQLLEQIRSIVATVLQQGEGQ